MIHDDVRDNGLQELVAHCDLLVICSQEPTTFEEAYRLVGADPAGYRLGSAVPSISLADGADDGRRARVEAITSGTVEATGGSSSGMWWACLDTSGERILSADELTGDQVVTEGGTFSLEAFDAAVFRD